jgi:transcriptional regulator with XRE-family HTH domain
MPDTRFIRKALIDRGWSMTRLARAVRMSRPHVSGVVHGRYRSRAAQDRVAKALGLRMERAFPKEGR